MKHFMYIMLTIVMIGLLSGCSDYAANTATLDADELAEIVAQKVAEECEPEIVEVEVEVPVEGNSSERILPIVHINGEYHEVDEELYIMLEYRTLKYTKYQVSYISCTCRSADVNYRQVMYIELNNSDSSVKTISFGIDGENGHYTPGTWGDSSPIPLGQNHTKEDFQQDLIEGYLLDKTPEDLAHISDMRDMTDWEHVDSYVGNSVTVHNMVRAVQVIQAYHAEVEASR